MADGARRDLAEGLGPEFQDFDIADLHPRNFVRKHLLDELEPEVVVPEPEMQTQSGTLLQPGETPPYDSEAT
jgi:sec-independent protein translocase protein TatB